MKRRCAGGVTLLGLALAAACRPCLAAEPPERYFYFGHEYGSQALYGPLYVLINRGFDVLQMRPNHRGVFAYDYERGGRNVARNFAHPIRSIGEEGWGPFLKEEIFPLGFTRETARWVPNYSLHLIGGGMTYTALREWYEAHGAPLPGVMSAATNLAAAFVNETLENKAVDGTNTDAIADFFVFDIGGILLFSFDGVNEFFSRELHLADWSLQPSLTVPDLELHNQGQYFAAKWPLPPAPRLRLFCFFGMSSLGGLSWKLDRELSSSAAAGVKATRLLSLTSDTARATVSWAPSAAVFLDRNDSLLAALQVSDVQDYFVSFNLYPRAMRADDPAVGLWTVLGRHGETILGISSAYTFGVGTGTSPP